MTRARRASAACARGAWLVITLLCSTVALADAEARADAPAVAPQPGRPGASRAAEPAELTQLQRQLDSMGTASGCAAVYEASKAQAWINFGKYASAAQLPYEVRTAALGNGRALVESLIRHAPVSHDTPELPRARHVRDDLWRGIAGVEADGRVCAAPKMTAYCEVELAWVGYEAGAGGWRHVDPYVRIAEDYCGTAIRAQVSPPPSAPELPAPVAAAAPEAESPPDLSVFFPHDRSRRGDIRRPGRARLRELAGRWQSGTHSPIQLIGHADLTGDAGYNLRLSERRARSVEHELVLLGIPLEAMRIEAVGSARSIVQCRRSGETAERRRYLACLEPNRRVVAHINGP